MISAPTSSNLLLAAKYLKEGKLVGLPTETVYGLAANALDRNAVNEIFALKGRPATNPLIVHIAEVSKIRELIDLTSKLGLNEKIEALAKLWPGPLSLVLPKSKAVPDIVTAGKDSVAVRIPNHPVALELLKLCKFPIAAPSANRSNYISPTKALHVEEEFRGALSMILDGGNCSVGLESTVLSLLGSQPQILRPGAVSKEQLEEVLNEEVLLSKDPNSSELADIRSPGMLSKHYSPRTPLGLASQWSDPEMLNGKRVGLIKIGGAEPKSLDQKMERVSELSEKGDLREVAHNLFATLREYDSAGLDLILIEDCKKSGLGRAIMDRIQRAFTV